MLRRVGSNAINTSPSCGQDVQSAADTIVKAKKLLIIGSPASGKTTFARLLGGALERDFLSLDDIYWLSGWKRRPYEDFEQSMSCALDEASWIIEGNHLRSLMRRMSCADTVLFLDYPLWTCVVFALRRWLTRVLGDVSTTPAPIVNGSRRAYRLFPRLRFLRLILTFRWTTRKRMLSSMAVLPHACKIIVIKSRRDGHLLLGAVRRSRKAK